MVPVISRTAGVGSRLLAHTAQVCALVQEAFPGAAAGDANSTASAAVHTCSSSAGQHALQQKHAPGQQPLLQSGAAASMQWAAVLRQQQQQRGWSSAAEQPDAAVRQDDPPATSASDRLAAFIKQQQQPYQHQQRPMFSREHDSMRTELEKAVLLCNSVQQLQDMLVQRAESDSLTAKQAIVSLNTLSKLNKAHRTALKHEIRGLQNMWQSLRPLDDTQQQQWEQLQQQHAEHKQRVEAVLAQLVHHLAEKPDELPQAYLVQVVGCFGSLACAHCVPGGSALLVLVLQRLVKEVHTLQPRHVAYLTTALGQLQDAGSASGSSYDHIPDETAAELPDNSSSTTAPGTSSSGSRGLSSDLQHEQEGQAVAAASQLLVQELCTAVQSSAMLMDVPSLANFVAGMARMGHYDWQAMRHVGEMALRQQQWFHAPQAAKMLAGLTKLRHYDAELCAGLADAAQRDMSSANGLQICQVVWSLAHQRFEQPAVYEAASLALPFRISELQPRHVASLAWAFAVRKAYSPPVYDGLGTRMVQLLKMDRLPDSSSSDSGSTGSSSTDSLFVSDNDIVLPHHLSLMAWSFAKQGHKHEPMMTAIADRATHVVGQMLPQNVSNTAWAYGALGMYYPALCEALASVAKASRLEGYNDQNITDLAKGLAQSGHKDTELFALIASVTSGSMLQLSPHSLCDLVWAFASTHDPLATEVLTAAAPAAISVMPRLSVAMLSDLMWSYAEVGLKQEDVLKAAAQAVTVRLSALGEDVESQAKIIWAMRQLDWRDEELVQSMKTLVDNLEDLLASPV